MKTVTQKDTVFPYKIERRPSPMPYLLAGAVFLLYGILRPMAGAMSYLVGAVIAVGGYFVGRGIWPDQRIKIELPPDTGDVNTNLLLTEARQQLTAIRVSNEQIDDPKVSRTIDSIEAICLNILARLEENPELYGQLRTFLRYYLPTTEKLLASRAAIKQGGDTGENARKVTERTDRVLPEIERAFEKQLEALDKHKYLDIQVEMDVLEGMLKSSDMAGAREQ